MDSTYATDRLAATQLGIGRAFGLGGDTWTVSGENAAGATVALGTVSPLYVLQEQPSRIERALAQSAAALRTRWSAVARTDDAPDLVVGNTITSIDDSRLAFLITGLDRDETPGLTQATLEKQPFT